MREEDLILCEIQYTIRHTSPHCFKVGKKVFVKSNPEHPTVVYSVNKDTVTISWYNKKNELDTCGFPPECILQYKYAGLVTYKRKHKISLN